ncbi:hypothetical protein T492DRAFT_1068040 [Pavlovales sp. CCMP2436]|nr:hypothetical protein T492DRAFT_1068040 [Pavlovales sp. CCMP2436]
MARVRNPRLLPGRAPLRHVRIRLLLGLPWPGQHLLPLSARARRGRRHRRRRGAEQQVRHLRRGHRWLLPGALAGQVRIRGGRVRPERQRGHVAGYHQLECTRRAATQAGGPARRHPRGASRGEEGHLLGRAYASRDPNLRHGCRGEAVRTAGPYDHLRAAPAAAAVPRCGDGGGRTTALGRQGDGSLAICECLRHTHEKRRW